VKIAICLIPVLLCVKNAFTSNPKDSVKISVLPVPTLGYAPETRGYAGAVCQLAFKSGAKTRLSSVKAEFQYTQRKQSIAELSGSVFLPAEKWLINFLAHSSRFPDYWWGIGAQTPEIKKEAFNSKRNWLEVSVLKKVGVNWFLGPIFRQQRRNEIAFAQTPSSAALKVTAAGLQCLHDSRNNMLNPANGAFLDVQLTRNVALEAGNGNRILMDGRRYMKTGQKSVAAGRMAFSYLSSPTHFFDLALLGGDRNLRGYYLGRFRDQGMLVFNGEFRTVLHKRWGATMGVAAGTVFSKPTAIFINPFKPAFNAGLRFVADRRENINLRIDYAMGIKGQSGFYFAFGEAF
jgi:Omp85 superfamily domain